MSGRSHTSLGTKKVGGLRGILPHVDQILDVSQGEIVQDGGVVEVRQAGHVLAHVELGRVDLCHLVLFELFHLDRVAKTIFNNVQQIKRNNNPVVTPHRLALDDLNLGLATCNLLDEALQELALGVGHPARLFGVVRLLHVLSLLFMRNVEKRRRIGVRLVRLQHDPRARHGDLLYSSEEKREFKGFFELKVMTLGSILLYPCLRRVCM